MHAAGACTSMVDVHGAVVEVDVDRAVGVLVDDVVHQVHLDNRTVRTVAALRVAAAVPVTVLA